MTYVDLLVSSIIFPAKTFTSVPCAQNWFCTLQWPAVGPDLLESSSSELAHITSRQIKYRRVFLPIEATSLPLSLPCNFPSSCYTSDLEMKLICKAFVNTKTYVYYTQNLWRFILEFAMKCLKKINCSICTRYGACYLMDDTAVHLQGSHYGTLVGKVTFGGVFLQILRYI